MKKTKNLLLKGAFCAFFVCFFPALALFGAEITVPRLEFASRGTWEDDRAVISSSAEADISLSGGYKYGITLGMGFEAPDMEKALSYGRLALEPITTGSPPTDAEYNETIAQLNDRWNNQATLSFRVLEATIRDLFNKPLDLSFFVGKYDPLSSGDEFPDIFGADPIGTDFRGFFYFPKGIAGDPGNRYTGAIHRVMGTGFKFSYTGLNFLRPSLYVYQDLSYQDSTGAYTPGCYSGDLRIMANSPNIKVEFFAGGTYRTDSDPVFRGGLLAFFSSGAGIDLLIQAGIPFWEYGSTLSIDNCYFLMEPRFIFGRAGVNVTFFYHPVYYMNRESSTEQGMADINLKLYLDNADKTVQGGIEGTAGLKIDNGEDFSLWVSPFVSAVTSGLRWDFKVRFNALYFTDGGSLAEAYLGIRTAF